MSKRKQPETDADLSFEEALKRLESIVETMETEALPLEELVTGYEKGSELLARCDSLLNSAQKRIKLVTLKLADAGKQPMLAETDQEKPDSDDDVRLF